MTKKLPGFAFPELNEEPGETDDAPANGEPFALVIDGVLDLHTFNPRDVKDLVPEYLRICRERGILDVRIIHGKGTGHLQRTVHSILLRMTEVTGFHLADETAGSWGATVVTLRPLAER